MHARFSGSKDCIRPQDHDPSLSAISAVPAVVARAKSLTIPQGREAEAQNVMWDEVCSVTDRSLANWQLRRLSKSLVNGGESGSSWGSMSLVR